MRIIRFLIFYTMVSVLGLMALLFLALNHYTVRLNLISGEYPVSIALVMVGAAAGGFVIALLVLLPGRIAAGLHARAVGRDVRELDHQLWELEHLLDEREEWYARLLDQHDMLLERHERMVVRHETLVDDYSQIMSERDKAHAQLAALRIARPAISAPHTSAAATALRLLPNVGAPPVVRPTTPVPAARAKPAKPKPQPATKPEPGNITPGPWGAAPPAEAATSGAADTVKPIAVPVETRDASPASPAPIPAAATPGAEPPESRPIPASEDIETSEALETFEIIEATDGDETTETNETLEIHEASAVVSAPVSQRRSFLAGAQAGVRRGQRAAAVASSQLLERAHGFWDGFTAQAHAQGRAQLDRMRRLRQRIASRLASDDPHESE